MAEIIVVTSGKGGVGKTTTSASIATGLARRGKKVAVIDFDVGLRNLDLIMGCERRVVYDFVNVIHGEATLKQALIKDKRFDNLYVLAASQTRDKDALSKDGVEKVLKDLAAEGFDYVICDSPAGIEKGAFLAMYFADKAIVVVNPEVSSVRDSDRVLGLLASKTHRAERSDGEVSAHLLLTRYSPVRVESGEMLSINDVEEVLGLKTIGVIPESGDVLNASNKGEPVIMDGESIAGQAYDDAVARLLGEDRPLRFTTVEKKGFFSKLFGGLGMAIFDFLKPKKNTASVAKNRLQIIIAQERSSAGAPDYLPLMRREILEVIRKYVNVDTDAVKVDVVKDGEHDVLDISVSLPERGASPA